MLPKRRRHPSLDETLDQAPNAARHPHDGQSRNRVVDGGCWDAHGRYWGRDSSGEWLSREDVEGLLADGASLLRHSDGDAGLAWYGNADGRAMWRDVFSDRFVEDNGVSDFEDAGWPGQSVYSAELCMRSDGERLIWLEEHC